MLQVVPTLFRKRAKHDEKPINWLAERQTRRLSWQEAQKEFFKIERAMREYL